MRFVTDNATLDCAHLPQPDLVHPKIKQDTKGRDLLQFQEDQKQKWTEYHFQLIVDAVAVEAITAAVDKQYIDELREEYVGYKNATIKTMIKQLQSWFVITNSEKIAIKATFLAPWSDTPNAHITTFARQLDHRQIECNDHGVIITDDEKVVHFIQEMYTCGLFEAKFLNNGEESGDKSWTVTLTLFTQQFNKERRTLKCAHNNKNYESINAFCERRATGSYGHNATSTVGADYTAAMEYVASLEIKPTQQEGRILELEDALSRRMTVTLPPCGR